MIEHAKWQFRPLVYQDTLLHAIREENVELVRIILRVMEERGIAEKREVPRIT